MLFRSPTPPGSGRNEATVEEATVDCVEVADLAETEVAGDLLGDSPCGVGDHGDECYAAARRVRRCAFPVRNGDRATRHEILRVADARRVAAGG